MLIIAHHNISDPAGFWAAAENVTHALPGNLQVHGVYPAMDGKTGTCLWEANSVEEVQQFLDKSAGQFATNLCYEVNVAKSVGLPKIEVGEAQMA